MFKKYTEKEIEVLREGGRKLAWIMNELEKFLSVGLSVNDIENKSLELIAEVGAEPATVGYTPRGASFPFPSSVCTSINDGVAHGISKDNQYKIKSGDVVSLDIVIKYKGLFVDTCRTYPVGKMSKNDLELISVARAVTDNAIESAIVGNTTENIGKSAYETAKKYGFDTVKMLGGHGVGKKIHDTPFVPNAPNLGVPIVKLKEGMVIAIEPIVSAGTDRIKDGNDGYLYVTADGKKSAQFEETVLITKNGPEILTKI